MSYFEIPGGVGLSKEEKEDLWKRLVRAVREDPEVEPGEVWTCAALSMEMLDEQRAADHAAKLAIESPPRPSPPGVEMMNRLRPYTHAEATRYAKLFNAAIEETDDVAEATLAAQLAMDQPAPRDPLGISLGMSPPAPAITRAAERPKPAIDQKEVERLRAILRSAMNGPGDADDFEEDLYWKYRDILHRAMGMGAPSRRVQGVVPAEQVMPVAKCEPAAFSLQGHLDAFDAVLRRRNTRRI